MSFVVCFQKHYNIIYLPNPWRPEWKKKKKKNNDKRVHVGIPDVVTQLGFQYCHRLESVDILFK